MIRENHCIYSDDRRFFAREADGYDDLTSYVWIRCEPGLNDNTMGKIGYHSAYLLVDNPDVPESIMRESREFHRAASDWLSAEIEATRKAEDDAFWARMAAEREAYRANMPKTQGWTPANEYIGEASMDAEDSIF